MSLTAWIEYCKGKDLQAIMERDEQDHDCLNDNQCHPWSCPAFTDGFGMSCPYDHCPSPYFTPDPTDPDEREAWKAMMANIKKPTVTQLTLW